MRVTGLTVLGARAAAGIVFKATAADAVAALGALAYTPDGVSESATFAVSDAEWRLVAPRRSSRSASQSRRQTTRRRSLCETEGAVWRRGTCAPLALALDNAEARERAGGKASRLAVALGSDSGAEAGALTHMPPVLASMGGDDGGFANLLLR